MANEEEKTNDGRKVDKLEQKKRGGKFELEKLTTCFGK